MMKNKLLPPPKGPPIFDKNDVHWTKQVRETVASAFHDDLPVSIDGGAENGQFCYLGLIRVDKINYHGGKLTSGDILLVRNSRTESVWIYTTRRKPMAQTSQPEWGPHHDKNCPTYR